MAPKRIAWFEELRISDRPSAGGKCASLGELIAAGIPVPLGFTVTAQAWAEVIEFADLGHRIGDLTRAVDPNSSSALREVRQQAVEIIHGATLPPGLEEDIREAYATLCARTGRDDLPVAVRSSAVAEDGAANSFAGQQETYLWVQGADQVVLRVRDCWASLFTPQAVAYRAKLDQAHRDEAVKMAVGVQEMVDAEVAGVAFTVSPTTGDPSVMAVNASWGLGEAVVSGEVTPDEFWLSKIGLTVTRKTVTHKAHRCVPAPTGRGTQIVDVPADIADSPCLSDELLHELGEIALRVEKHYGTAQDIEWALARDPDGSHRFMLLQSRPETVNQATRAAIQERTAARTAGAQAYLSVLKGLGLPGQGPG
ncbi:MAG TPA: PEP/pyruvate-binding domain-containing protein [Actinomycetes bacterium]|nr:PEP/pyruvate-binding domain-containing protein [Actinomycetes bacterium]